MAIPLRFQLLILLLILIFISLFISAATSTATTLDEATVPSISPSSTVFQNSHTYSPTLFATILSTLGFQELSTATATANLSAITPLTIFAPFDSSLLTCPSCSIPLLLQELSVPGLYPLHFLHSLAFGTKIETLAPNRCVTITTSSSTFTASGHPNKGKIFVNGLEITRPDLFNNGLVVIHGLQGFVSHLSPLSCNVERMTSLSFPPPALSTSISTPFSSIMRLMLKDAILRLRTTGYSVVSLALRVKFTELSELKVMTVFALDDASIFSGGGNAYLSNFRYHVVPNKRLTAAELVSLQAATVLPTMDAGQNLVVTTAGGGGPLAPMKINYVRVTTIDLLHNSRIVIHGVSVPFPHMHHPVAEKETFEQIQLPQCDQFGWNNGICQANAQVPAAGIASTVDSDDHHGL
ncbi:fasciclin-like arabinogalactan protein 21 [Forsythia ovata]|uniref:Fasciclin-like arabinogalactan protein 21 n=1 Tax=Forsythia ovata TaxID=205694 RepID=A0ABD1QLT8_9LAMI